MTRLFYARKEANEMTKDMRIEVLTEKYNKVVADMDAMIAAAVDENGEERAFNEEEQEAVARFAAGDQKRGLVIDCVQRGYKLGDHVLRYAKVVVGE